jgi:hypothetical protein
MELCRLVTVCLLAALATPAATSAVSASAAAEPQRRQPVPRPFPRPGDPSQDAVEARDQRPTRPAPISTAATQEVPTEATLGLPIYPNARFITSYDAGRGQRYYLFGTNSSFQEMVAYYAVVLDERGDRVFDAPATHIFEVGRFREEEMAFPPSVTIKDYTWNGSDGYLNPSGGEPDRFKTVIQLVPQPPGQPQR